jgi:hypothetical protein
VVQASESPRFRLAHELLQEIPEDEQLADQARKTYEDVVWRYKYR